MAVHLDTRASDFADRFRALLDTKREAAEDVEAAWKMLTPHILSQIEEYASFTVEFYGEQAGPYKGEIDPQAIRNNPAYRVMTPAEAGASTGAGIKGKRTRNAAMPNKATAGASARKTGI